MVRSGHRDQPAGRVDLWWSATPTPIPASPTPCETVMTTSIDLTVITANIGRKHASKENIRQNIALLNDAGSDAIIGFQEIDEADVADEHDLKQHGLPH